MIKVDEGNLEIRGERSTVQAEFTILMKAMIKNGIFNNMHELVTQTQKAFKAKNITDPRYTMEAKV